VRRAARVIASLSVLCACGSPPAPVPASEASNITFDLERHTPVLGLTLTPEQIAKRALPAVVTIRGDEAMGTGFVVRSDGWIATNVHVLSGQHHLHVVTADGVDHEGPRLIAFDGKRDLAGPHEFSELPPPSTQH
jgi:S1-C subfamily serine protease